MRKRTRIPPPGLPPALARPGGAPSRSWARVLAVTGPLAVLLAACGGGGGGSGTPLPVTPALNAALNAPSCYFQYTLTAPSSATGTDPLLSRQWHLKNTGQSGGTPGEDIRALAAWGDGAPAKGAGARVAVVDGGVELTHQDLAPNIADGASRNYLSGAPYRSYPMPCDAADVHGTSVAGLLAARDDNGFAVAGVAPRASIAAYNAIATSYDADLADALSADSSVTGVYNSSWGSPDNGTLNWPDAAITDSITSGLAQGRSGKGSIYVFAGGNGGCYPSSLVNPDDSCRGQTDNSNFDGYVNQLGVIAVCSTTNRGRSPWYAEPGANLLVCGSSSGRIDNVVTTAVGNGTRLDFSGTSASAPQVSGVVALMLGERPDLSWRDVRLILAQTARRNDPDDAGWSTWTGVSGTSYHFNHKYGFGTVDAQAATRLAKGWTSVGGSSELVSCGPYQRTPAAAIADVDVNQPNTVTPVSDAITVGGECAIRSVEMVRVRFDASHPKSGDLRVRLTSPAGNVSELATARECFALNPSGEIVQPVQPGSCGDYHQKNGWPFTSSRHIGEAPNGSWTLQVTDMRTGGAGTWNGWTLELWGRK